ncbi:MAG: hypothetical protein GXY58_15640 [Planctomycetaceae bacterium]|nr:hypothetical protein [Planctomycetaceae bacterium]
MAASVARRHITLITLQVRSVDRVGKRLLLWLDSDEAIRHEGSTLSDGTYRTVLNNSDGYQNCHRVYDRADELCPTCERAVIRRIVQAQRSTFFCPTCQRR